MKKMLFGLFLCVSLCFTASAKNLKTEKLIKTKFPVVFSICGFTIYGDYQCPGCSIQQMLSDIALATQQLTQQLCGTPPVEP